METRMIVFIAFAVISLVGSAIINYDECILRFKDYNKRDAETVHKIGKRLFYKRMLGTVLIIFLCYFIFM